MTDTDTPSDDSTSEDTPRVLLTVSELRRAFALLGEAHQKLEEAHDIFTRPVKPKGENTSYESRATEVMVGRVARHTADSIEQLTAARNPEKGSILNLRAYTGEVKLGA